MTFYFFETHCMMLLVIDKDRKSFWVGGTFLFPPVSRGDQRRLPAIVVVFIVAGSLLNCILCKYLVKRVQSHADQQLVSRSIAEFHFSPFQKLYLIVIVITGGVTTLTTDKGGVVLTPKLLVMHSLYQCRNPPLALSFLHI